MKSLQLVLAWVLICGTTASAQIIGDDGPSQLNVLFMVESISIYVVVLGIFFFWNRILGGIVGFALRQYLWKTADAHISIGSLQLSPLAGRILFKDVRYHSTNMSARVLLGHITWRYWKWRIRKEDSDEDAPCRCQIHLEGLEWFLYNRTPSFDAIVERMQEAERKAQATSSGKAASTDESSESRADATQEGDPKDGPDGTGGKRSMDQSEATDDGEQLHRPLSPPLPAVPPKLREALGGKSEKMPWQWQRDVFPFGIDISHGAVVIGNDATPTVTIAEFGTAEGVVRTEESRSRFDLFKQVVDMQFTDIQVLIRTNPDFTGTLLDHGKKAYDEIMATEPDLADAPPSTLITRPAFRALANKYKSLTSQYSTKIPTYAQSYYGPEKEWKGLARYRDDTDISVALRAKETEYAKVTTLMSTRRIEMTYYADVAGLVPERWERIDTSDEDFHDELGNGDLPPQWGIDFVVFAGVMTYGPWADRQRAAFNQAFLPAIFYHTPQTETLKPGDFRKHVAMNVDVEIREATVWRMPTRESSKDWMYEDSTSKSSVEQTRKYGWLDVSIGPRSSVHYTVPLTAKKTGFEAELKLDLSNIRVTSSVNHTEWLDAKSCSVNAKMPTPLQWDARRDWTFDISLDQVRALLLRDHTTLIGDLAKDWNSGPTGDFHHFVPMDYQFNFSLTNFEIKLYLNDFNIINQPLAFEDNAFVNICGPKITGGVEVPLIRYRPESSTIPFTVEGEDVLLTMDLPRWQTHSQTSFGAECLHNLGRIRQLHLRGSYLYFSEVHPDHVEALSLNIDLDSVNFRAFGWAIRRLMSFKDNYFGGFNSWTNMAEFRKKYEAEIPSWGDAMRQKYRPGKSDKFEVTLDLICRSGKVILPEDIYDCDGAIIVPIPKLQVHLRTHESLMQVSIDSGPVQAWYSEHSGTEFDEFIDHREHHEFSLTLAGISIKGNRLFGKPPLNPTYFCLWNIEIDSVDGYFNKALINGFHRAIRTFKFNFADMENAPLWLYMPPTDPDVTLLKLSVGAVTATIPVDIYALQLCADSVSLSTNDLASTEYAKLLSLAIPCIIARVIRRKDDVTESPDRWSRIAYLRTAIFLDRHSAPANWKHARMKQQRFVRSQDQPSRRCGPLYGQEASSEPFYNGVLYCPSPFDPTFDLTAGSGHAFENDDASSLESSSDDEDEVIDPHGQDLAKDTAFRESKRRGIRSQCPELPVIKAYANIVDSTEEPQRSDQGAANERDQSFLTINTGDVMRLEVSPYLVDALQCVRKDFADEEITYRRLLDSLLVEQTSRIRAARDVSVPSDAQSMISIPVAQVSFIQHCASPFRSGLAATIASDTTLELSIKNLALRTQKARELDASGHYDGSQFLGVACDTISLRGEQNLTSTNVQLGRNDGSGKPQADLDDNLRFELAFSDASLEQSSNRLGEQRIQLQVDSVTGLGGSLSPVLASVMAMSWYPHIQATMQSFDGQSRVDTTQTAISRIVKGVSHVKDPQCLTSRFELLRHQDISRLNSLSATHVNVAAREDPGWLALAYLRVAMSQRGLVHTILETDAADNIATETIAESNKEAISKWRKHNLFHAMVETIPFLQSRKIPKESATPSMGRGRERRLISGSIANLDLRMQDQRQGAQVNLVILAMQEVVVSLFEQDVSGTREVDERNAQCDVGSCRIEAHVYLLDRLQDVAPSVMDTLATVCRTRSSVGQMEESPAVQRKHVALPLIAIVQVRNMVISAIASPLLVEMTVSNLELMVKKGMSSIPEMVNLLVANTRVRLLSITPRNGMSPTYLSLVSLEFDTTRLSIFNARDGKATDHRASIIVYAGHALVHTRATPHIMHSRIQEWLDDYKSKYSQTLDGLRGLGQTQRPAREPQTSPLVSPSPRNLPVGKVIVIADRFACNVRISKEVTAFWTVNKTHVRLLAIDLEKHDGFQLNGGLRLGEQAIGFSKSSAAIVDVDDAPSPNDVLLRVPVILFKSVAQFSQPLIQISGDICIHHFNGTLKPSTFDRVLAMYRAIGSDIKAISRLLSDTRKSAFSFKQQRVAEEQSEQKAHQRFIINLAYECKGIHLSLKATDVVSTLLIQSGRIYGNFSRDTDITGESWSAKLDSLELSLGHAQEPLPVAASTRDRAVQSAYLLCAFAVEQSPRLEETSGHKIRPTAIINTNIQRVHAVMHVSALEEIYDLLNSWSRDLKILAERRRREWQEIKEGTKELIRADVKTGEAEAVGWMESAILTVIISSFAVAVPLHAESVLDNRQLEALPAALLFTIGRLEVINRKGESGRTGLQDMHLQYVDSFDSSDNRHYDGTFHASNNKMHLPEATLQFRLQDGVHVRSLKVDSIFKGFELRLDRHVTRYMAETYVVYVKGKQQIEQLYRAYPLDATQSKPAETQEDEQLASRQSARKRLSLQCAAEFVSGKVLLVKGGQENLPSRRNTFASGHDTPEQQKSAALAESISLPGVSLWIDSVEGTEDDPGTCQISVIIQESENILKPSILQFVESATAPNQTTSGILAEARSAEEAAEPALDVGTVASNGSSSGDEQTHGVAPPSVLASLTATTRLIVSLRIDRSRLALSCEPDNPVLADLAWDSGGFTLQCKPKAETIVASVQVSSVAFHLYREIYTSKHVFVSGKLAELTASAVFRNGSRLPVLEALVYSKVSADFNIKLLRQWFAFNSVWLERLSPITRSSNATGAIVKPVAAAHASAPVVLNRGGMRKIGKQVVICLRLQEVVLKANLDVSKVDVVIPLINARLAANDTLQRMSVTVDGLNMTGTKTISGKIVNEGITFTAERKRILREDKQVTVMKIGIDSKDTVAALACTDQQVFGLHISPTVVELQDDWQVQLKDGGVPVEPKLALAFVVNLGLVNVMFAMLALNALLDESDSFLRRIDDEKREAEHSSAAYRHHLANKPKNAITAVAETVQKSRSAQPACGPVDFSIDQRLVVETKRINIAIQATNEEKIYVFRLTPVQAKYQKAGDTRLLEAEVETVRLTRDKAKDVAMLRDMKLVGEWLENQTGVTREEILSLPFITILMESEEHADERFLDYDFDINYHNQKIKIALTMQAIRDAQEAYSIAKQIRAGKEDRAATVESHSESSAEHKLVLRPRKVNLKPPPADYLGSTTDEMLKILKYHQLFQQAPYASHIAQTRLDLLMDLLLTIYNKLECNLP